MTNINEPAHVKKFLITVATREDSGVPANALSLFAHTIYGSGGSFRQRATSLALLSTVKLLRIRTPEKIAVITLKLEQSGFTVE